MGECKKCGECCKWMTFSIPGLARNAIFRDYYTKHGCKVKGDVVLIPSRCQNLGEDNLCKIYPNRPSLCKAYKGKKESNLISYFVPEGCGLND